MLNKILKISLLAIWLLFAISFIKPFPEPYQVLVFWLGIFLVVAHAFEYILKYKDLRSLGFNGFIQTMLFGLIYWLPVLKKAKAEA